MGLTLLTPKFNDTLKYRQDELLRGSFLKSLFLKNAFSNNYSIVTEEDIRNLSILIDGTPRAIIYHEKRNRTPLIKTPIGIHITKLGFYTLLMTNTSNEDLISVMTNKDINKTWVTTQGFVLPTKLVDGLNQTNFFVQKNVNDRRIKELQNDPYNILGESISMIERKLKNITKTTKADIGIVLPRNRNLLEVWNHAFMELNTIRDASTLKFNYKENMKITDYFPYIKQFLWFIYSYDKDNFDKVIKDVLELKYMDVKYMNIADRGQRQTAEQSRRSNVDQTITTTADLDSLVDGPIDLIQATTKTTRTASVYEGLLASVPPISIGVAKKYGSFRPLYNEFKSIKDNINSQAGIIQQDMTKNYVNCNDQATNNKLRVFGDINTLNLCKKYNEVAIGNAAVKKIHKETAKAFADVLMMVLKSQKKILTYSYEFILEYKSDAANFQPTKQEVIRQQDMDSEVENVSLL